ncbi:oxidoreductase [Aurantimicrobium minutum]|uniref:oxidoreductase n=1 Tax=Aurantimicrobium minutum TaxID=708131 RepID=UPI0024755B12|nr:oxidoreductase [Aurantimicrobium minutum]MDH6208407.1 3-hydroxy-9,10-secoandrosta-1,3,5(10)-triene-9,17-dione monooxygenase [Aurantimicrobium minutum]
MVSQTLSANRTEMASDVPSLLAKIDEMRLMLETNGARGEEDRNVLQESVDALEAVGAFRVTQPKKYGGFQGRSQDHVDVARAVGRGDGGTGWITALINMAGWLTALMPEKAQDDVWAEDPNTKVTVVLATNGSTKRVPGGYIVSGEWSYASGSRHAQWAFLGALLVDEDGNFDDAAQLLIPATDLSLKETWFVSGMRSSGSNTWVAEEVFVPDYRVLRGTPALLGDYPGTNESTPNVYKAGWIPWLNVILAGAQLGIGRAVLDKVIAGADKPIAYTNIEHKSDSVAFQLEIAKAALTLDSADLMIERACKEIDGPAAEGYYPDYLTRARNRAYVGWAAETVSHAIESLLTAHGSGGFAEANSLQRFWRDQAVAARHAFILPALGYELYGKALLGREDGPTVTPLV